MQKFNHKTWLLVTLAAALTLGACADKGSATTEDDPTLDAQTAVEQQATGVASANTTDASTSSDDIAVAIDDGAEGDLTNEDIGIADSTATGIDDADIIDGSESEEHVSTY